MEKEKIDVKWGIMFAIITSLVLIGIFALLLLGLPVYIGKTDNCFNPKQEIIEERFTKEYVGILIVYHIMN